MKMCTIFRSKKYSPIQKVVLALSLIGAGVVSFLPVGWAYRKIQTGVGMEAAQVTLALQVILLLVLTTAGAALGYLVDWSIRRRKSIFGALQPGSWAGAFVRLWGYEITFQEEFPNESTAESDLLPDIDEVQKMIDQPKYRGRKPVFPLERWLPIAAKWENRDPIWDAFTLADLISEHLGQNADGSPVVSEQAYYSIWRERALKELKRRAEVKKASKQSNHEKPIK